MLDHPLNVGRHGFMLVNLEILIKEDQVIKVLLYIAHLLFYANKFDLRQSLVKTSFLRQYQIELTRDSRSIFC